MDLDRRIGMTSALAYSVISIGASALFFVAATLTANNDVARFGGAVWVLLLSFIVTMPLVTSFVKTRMKA